MHPDNDILYYDGDCNLCNRTVKWVAKHDKGHNIALVPLRSDEAQKALQHLTPGDTVVYYKNNIFYTRSDAALQLVRSIGGIWRVFLIFRWVPLPIRNRVYDLIAAKRIHWFGKKSCCEI